MTTILIIQDDETLRLTGWNLLLEEDFNIIFCENGFLGLYLAQQVEPDLILSDLNYGFITGYEILQKIRCNPKTARIPFLFLTEEDSEEMRCKLKEFGVNEYLVKPCSQHQILQAILNQISVCK